MEECVFCRIVKGEIKKSSLMESNSFLAFEDIHPKAEGHMIVIPKKHFVTLMDIPNHLGSEMLEFVKKVAWELMNGKKGDGFNLVMNNLEVAGQVVNHAHIHIIPRNENDGLKVIS